MMLIRPVDLNGMIQRTDDVGVLKHQEDAKPLVDQQNIQNQVVQKQEMLLHQVQSAGSSDKTKNDADAKEEGKGTYYSNEKKKKNEKKQSIGKVINKKDIGGFDIKI